MAVTSLLDTGTAPTSDRQVWASPVALRANWKNPITVRTGFETRIQQALTLSEQRRILRGTPRRSLSCTLTGTGRVETLAARQLLTRMTMAGFLMPLYSDPMELQATASATATVLSVDPTYRRVFVGNRVMVLQTEHGVVTSFEVHVVDAVTAGTSITLASPGLAAEAPRGSLVIPLFESRIIDSFSNGFVLTDDKADFQNFTAQEQVGPTQIDGIVAIGALPSGFDTFNSLPVFAGPMDYSNIKYSINRIGSISTVGIGDLPVFYGERGVQQINALIQCLSRKEAWDTIRFFESRGGRAYPFWLRSPWEDYRVTGTNGANLLVEDTGELLDWNYRPYLVMRLSDGTFDYREIASVTQDGANHEIAFVGGAALGTIVDARQLLLVRMYRDEIAERWRTTEVCQMTLETVEILQEKVVAMTETLAASNGDSIVTSPDGDLIGLGVAITDDTTVAISPDIALGGCEASGVWHLKDCDTEALYRNTLTDLSAYVGGSVKLDGDDTCYEVLAGYLEGAVIQNVTVATDYADCETCDPPAVEPCTDCKPTSAGGTGADPKTAYISGASNNVGDFCPGTHAVAYSGYISEPNYCFWSWVESDGTSKRIVALTYAKAENMDIEICSTAGPAKVSLLAGEYYLETFVEHPTDPIPIAHWAEKTTTFTCDSTTGRVSGTHTYTVEPCGGDACSGNPTVTVDP